MHCLPLHVIKSKIFKVPRQMYGNQTLTQKLYGNPTADERRHLSLGTGIHWSLSLFSDSGSVSNTQTTAFVNHALRQRSSWNLISLEVSYLNITCIDSEDQVPIAFENLLGPQSSV